MCVCGVSAFLIKVSGWFLSAETFSLQIQNISSDDHFLYILPKVY